MKKSVKSLLATAIAFSLFLTGCAKPAEVKTPETTKAAVETTTETTTETKVPEVSSTGVLKIAVLQGVEHPALDASREGFLAALADNGYKVGEKIVLDYKNGQGDQSNLTTISQKFVDDKSDLVLAIGTQAAISMAAATKEIPIFITAVTDPKGSGLVKEIDKPGGNVTGTSDMTEINKQIDFMMKIAPNTKKLALMYTSSEENSIYQANIAEEYAKSLGLEVEHKTVTSVNDIAQVAESLVGKFDAIYMPTDNTLASAMPTVASIALANNIPIFPAEEGMVLNGGVGSISINYYELGYQTGEMAVKVLNGTEKPQDMPIGYMQKPTIVLNKAVIDKMGLVIPEDILKDAKMVNDK